MDLETIYHKCYKPYAPQCYVHVGKYSKTHKVINEFLAFILQFVLTIRDVWKVSLEE